MQYIVLKSISPPEGAIIEPAVPTAADPAPAPVLVDASLFSGETDDERAANIARLIAQGVIAPAEPGELAELAELLAPGPAADRANFALQPITHARPVARQNEE